MPSRLAFLYSPKNIYRDKIFFNLHNSTNHQGCNLLSGSLMLEQERKGIFYYHSSTLGGHCCPGPVTLKGGGDVEKKWPKYLGQYQTSEHLDHHGAPVYVNSFGRLLFVNDNGDWSANTVINDRGVFRGIGDHPKGAQMQKKISLSKTKFGPPAKKGFRIAYVQGGQHWEWECALRGCCGGVEILGQ